MKITQKNLIDIIKEELTKLLNEEEQSIAYAKNPQTGDFEKIMSVPRQQQAKVASADHPVNQKLKAKQSARGGTGGFVDADKYEANLKKIIIDNKTKEAAYNIISLLDPTMISNYPALADAVSAFKANKTWHNAFKLTLAAAAVIPVVGKVAGGAQKVKKLMSALNSTKKNLKVASAAKQLGKATSKVDSALAKIETAVSINALRANDKRPLTRSQLKLIKIMANNQPDSELMSVDNFDSEIKRKAISQRKYIPKNIKLKQIQDLVGANPTGKYDRETHDKIVAFQEKIGTKPDGVFGNKTLRAYNRLRRRSRRRRRNVA